MAHALTHRVDVEFTVDASAGQNALTTSALTALRNATGSFVTAWTAAFQRAPDTATSQLTTASLAGGQISATGTLNAYLRRGRFSPYLAAGGGAILSTGSASATLLGHLQLSAGGTSASETDVLTLVGRQGHLEPVLSIGGGFTEDVTPRSGLRLDVRVYLSGNSAGTFVSASPTTTTSPPGVITLIATGQEIQDTIVFSGTSGVSSTLSGPALSNVRTFTGSGVVAQASLTLGYFFRF